MEHLTEYQLIEYHFDELSYLERKIVEDHLNSCPECREKIEELHGELNSIVEIFPAEPDNVFWAAYPVRLRERMEKKAASPAAGYFQQWAAAVTGVAFSAVMVFFLMTGGNGYDAQSYYDGWAASAIDLEPEAYVSGDVDYVLAEIIDPVMPDFLPSDDYAMSELLETMSDDEFEDLFKAMENITI